eukprot:gene16436-22407_t
MHPTARGATLTPPACRLPDPSPAGSHHTPAVGPSRAPSCAPPCGASVSADAPVFGELGVTGPAYGGDDDGTGG